MGYVPIEPANLLPSSCPLCHVPARHRHCYHCKWLACYECGVVWSARTGGWISTEDQTMSGNYLRVGKTTGVVVNDARVNDARVNDASTDEEVTPT